MMYSPSPHTTTNLTKREGEKEGVREGRKKEGREGGGKEGREWNVHESITERKGGRLKQEDLLPGLLVPLQ